MTNIHTAKSIKKWRIKQLLGREEMAVLVGVSAQTIWRWEAGGRIPEPEQRLIRRVMAQYEDGP